MTSPYEAVSYAEARGRIVDAHPSMSRMPDGKSEVAKNFTIDGHRGSVSFVTSMTSSFCGGCNRQDRRFKKQPCHIYHIVSHP